MSKFLKQLHQRGRNEGKETVSILVKRERSNTLIHPLRFAGSYHHGLNIIKHLPKTPSNCGYLYIIQLESQRIKVGKTSKPYERLSTHQNNCKVYSGEEFNFIVVYGPFENIDKEEIRLIDFMLSLGAEPYGGNEWFYCPEPIHIFDLGYKPTIENFMFYWVQECFNQMIRDYINQTRKGKQLANPNIPTHSIFDCWLAKFQLSDDAPIESFLIFLKQFCKENESFHLKNGNEILYIDNLQYTSAKSKQ